MRTAFLLAAAVLILNPLQVLHAAANPDLVLLEIDWTPNPPAVGDVVHFTVPVQNQGDMDTPTWTGVCVRLFMDDFRVEDDCVDSIAQGATEIFDFYWRAIAGNHTVRAVADYGDSIPESDEDNNTREEPLCIAPGAPGLPSPPDDSSTCDTTPYFDWPPVSGATSYRIQVDDSSDFASPTVDATTSNSDYTPGTPLGPSTYYWRVRASHSCADGPWSSVWSVIVLSTPGTPSPSSPPDGSTSGDDTPTFAWASASGATSYRIQVDDDAAFSSPEVDGTASATTYTPGSALADGTYHWRVQASNACGDSPWSSTWEFTVGTPQPGKPQAILGVSPLRVRAGAESVRFDGSASFDPDGTVARYLFDFGDGTVLTWIEQPVRYHTYDRPGEYQARLKVQDDLGLTSAWSASQVVIVQDLPPDERAPDIWNVGLSPTPIYVNGCSGSITATVTCRVEDSSDVTYVILRYALGSELYDGTLMTPVADHVYRASVGDFEQGGTLHYYVETADAHSHYTRTSTYNTVVTECSQASADLRLADVAWSPSQPMALSSMNLALTLQNDGPGPFVPADGNYAVELRVDDGVVLGVPVPLRLSFSTEVESHRSRMTPVALERLSPGQSMAVMVRRIRLPQPVVNGTLDVRFIPADADRYPGNNAVQVPFDVAEDPQHPADCFTTAARIHASFLPDDVLTSPLAAALDGYLECQDEPACEAATLAEFFEATLTTALQQWATGAGDIGPTAVLAILDRLWQAAEDASGCDAWLAGVIGRVIASLDLDRNGFAANAIVVRAAAYPLVHNRAGQLAGFADSGESLNQVPGSRVSQTADSRIILVPGSDLESIRLRGMGYGTASVEIVLARADGSAVMLAYRDLPLTPQTIAILNLDTPGDGWILELDLNGDGIVDEARLPDTLEMRRCHWVYLPLVSGW